MVRCGSRLKKLTKNGVYIVKVRFTLLNQIKEIIIVSNGRDRTFEKKIENGTVNCCDLFKRYAPKKITGC